MCYVGCIPKLLKQWEAERTSATGQYNKFFIVSGNQGVYLLYWSKIKDLMLEFILVINNLTSVEQHLSKNNYSNTSKFEKHVLVGFFYW